jgi:hypothetical protein
MFDAMRDEDINPPSRGGGLFVVAVGILACWTVVVLLVLAIIGVFANAHAQSSLFSPGSNPVSNQGYDAAAIVVGTSFRVTRAVYNGTATACDITLKTNKGSTVTFANVPSGSFLPVQAVLVSATGCTGLLAIY